MKRNIIRFAIVALLFSSSCAGLFEKNQDTVKPIDYISGGKKLDYKSFFEGGVDGFSILKDQNGNIMSTRKVFIDGEWEGNKGTIKHRYVYNDGRKDSRTWLVTLHKDGTFDAIGHDVAAPAQGNQVANAAQSTYVLRVKNNNISEDVSYEDRMYLVDEDSMIMITNFKKRKPNASPEVRDNFGQIITSLYKVKTYKGAE
ncbi:MAG: DUF3833 family protein [Rickettsiales bacterium]|nr:DUF3833 family protein [Rickettsiales bacterium]